MFRSVPVQLQGNAVAGLPALARCQSGKARALPQQHIAGVKSFLCKHLRIPAVVSKISPTYNRSKHALSVCSSTVINRYSSTRSTSFHIHKSRDISDAAPSEEVYHKKSPVEHVLLRPGMYIGSVETVRETLWLPESDGTAMRFRNIEYVPGLIKIFDEILVNAADNKIRDPTTSRIDVNIIADGSGAPRISVRNNGRGIPVRLHAIEGVYIPELVLGHLLTGSNFDDSAGRLTGGRHGYGAKLTNIFSTEFVVETADKERGLQFKQVYRHNMHEREEPKVFPLGPNNEDFTKISFVPDMSRFDTEFWTEDMFSLLHKRVIDIAGCLHGVEVYWNGKKVSIENFQSYANLYEKKLAIAESFAEETEATTSLANPVARSKSKGDRQFYHRINKRWEVVVMPSSQGFQQISFVNNICTQRGGTHVNNLADQVCRRLADHINHKYKDIAVSPAQVKSQMALFVNCLVENPTFDSQMKEFLTSRPETFGSQAILSERFTKEIAQYADEDGIVARVVSLARTRQQMAMIKKLSIGANSRRRHHAVLQIPKLEDANDAGRHPDVSSNCTLILTEGDSAKALAVAGLAIVGRDRFGVFPLRGKLLNVRDASMKQWAENQEIKALCTILGLDFEKTYESEEERRTMRYGKIMIMTDQDHDGSHIKGLVINFLHHFWPKLLEKDGFLTQFITPIIKARKGKDCLSFFTLPEYTQWRQSMTEKERDRWRIKYYKGLGTNSAAEAREYFSNLGKHWVSFQWDGNAGTELIDMAFSKKRVEDRKRWLQNFNRQSYVDVSNGILSYSNFVNKELIQFSNADNERSIPSAVDGLKPSQRKILFASLKRNLKKEIKVVQLAGYCSEHTGYHHGEASLHSTIINMAQDYVGSNNIPLLYPSGQFGTRLQGGKDSASARYIFTRLGPYTRLIFPEADDPLLDYRDDDGFPIEPSTYMPVIPLLLINGSEGIGTGWSTFVPPHHPVDIINNVFRLMEGKEPVAMEPWVRGFQGNIYSTMNKSGYFTTEGVIHPKSSTELRITELPVGRWTDDYKIFLAGLATDGVIKGFKEHHSEGSVNFVVQMSRSALEIAMSGGNAKRKGGDAHSEGPEMTRESNLIKFFKLSTTLSTLNMNAFDPSGNMKKYPRAVDILVDFFPVRLDFYQKRKELIQDQVQKEMRKLKNRVRFIADVADGAFPLLKKGRTKAEIIADLAQKGFDPSSAFEKKHTTKNKDMLQVVSEENDAANSELSSASSSPPVGTGNYDYLLNIPIHQFTHESISTLKASLKAGEDDLQKIIQSSAEDLWSKDLEQLRDALEKDASYSRYSTLPSAAKLRKAKPAK